MIVAALVLGGGLVATTAFARKAAPKTMPKPTNAVAKKTDGLWHLKVMGGPAQQAAMTFNGDYVTYTDKVGTMIGRFASTKVSYFKGGMDVQATVTIQAEILPGKKPMVPRKTRTMKMLMKFTDANGALSFCATTPGDERAKMPTTAMPAATNVPGQRCFSATKLTTRTATAKESAPANTNKKRIKMRTRGLDWSLGR